MTKDKYEVIVIDDGPQTIKERVNTIKQDFTQIKIYAGKGKVKYNNPTSYKYLGRGYTGAVFKLSTRKCVKIFAEKEKLGTEAKALRIGECSPVIPKLYEIGPNYIIMEYIEGPNLYNYLKRRGILCEHFAKEILFCLKELKRLGFPRLNVHLRHFIVTRNNNLKVIDHANAYKEVSPKPTSLFKQLKKLGLLNHFLDYLKKTDRNTYNEWI